MATTKAIDIINKALTLIQVKTAGVELSDQEISDAKESLNDMMTALDAQGIRLGFTIIEDENDEITTPDWSFGMMKYNLALLVADEYGVNVTASLASFAREFMSTVRNRVVNISQPNFSDTLPTGSGHGQNCDRYNSNFFGNPDSNDLLLGNGEKMLDDEAEQLEFEDNNGS